MSLSTQSCAHPPLPIPDTAEGRPRKLGVEVEFTGLPEEVAAKVWARSTGGSVRQDGAAWICDTAPFGACRFYLDTKYRDDLDRLGNDIALGAARMVVPVELVSDPFDPAHLPAFDAGLGALRTAGAEGTGASVMYGFGVHLNVEIARRDGDHVARVATSFALLEPLLREVIGIDVSRRVLPFVDPYPRAMVTALANADAMDIAALADIGLDHTTSRNHGLDLLPIFAECAPDAVRRNVDPKTKITARPAYHYRLPESRIDRDGWGLAGAWRLWRAIEGVAGHDAALSALKDGWRDWSSDPHLTRDSWVSAARDILKTYGIVLEAS
ncbi:MAG: amidoligase family protein [Pseudomonadota bacterium]